MPPSRHRTRVGFVPEAAQSGGDNPRSREFNAAIEQVVVGLGGQLKVRYMALGYHTTNLVIETRYGRLDVHADGNTVNCRFHEPDRTTLGVNDYGVNTGKWHHHYFGWPLDAAVANFTRRLTAILPTEEPTDA